MAISSGRKRPNLVVIILAIALIALLTALFLTNRDNLPSWLGGTEKPVAASTQPQAKAQAIPAAPAQTSLATEASPAPTATPSNPRSPYKGFWYEANLTPERLAKLIEDALARDASGETLIDAAKCDRDGSCAAPLNYLESFQKYDRAAGLTHVSQLPKYVRKLVMDCSIRGRFMMADIYRPGQGRGRTETDRMSRLIRSNECVFKNPDTGQPVIAQFCANPVGKRVVQPPPPPPCVIIEFNHAGYEGGRVYWGAEEGPLEDDRCNAMSQGEGRWVSWTPLCRNCAVTAYESRSYASTARRQRLRFSEAVWRNGVRVCLESKDGFQTCYVSVPGPGKAWAGRHYVKIEDNLWRTCRRPTTL